MPELENIGIQGNGLVINISDGRAVACYATPNNLYVPRETIEVEEQNPTLDPIDQGTGEIVIGDIPDSLTARATNGTVYNLNRTQLTHAAGIIVSASKIEGIDRPAVLIALITAIVESVLYMYSNSSAYPDSVNYPHDKDGSDNDSVGLFQQRPASGWGRVEELMDTPYSTRAFIGGPTGPNNGSPRGLFDISNWRERTPGSAAQAVQVSAFPDRYDAVVPVAQAIMDALIISKPGGGDTGELWMWPFKYSQYVFQTGSNAPLAQFGMRVNPVTHQFVLHAGIDFGAGGIGANGGMPILAAAAGTVRVNATDARGINVTIDHGNGWKTNYFHMIRTPDVTTGQVVAKGQKLGNVGSTGRVTGAHLHWETIENGNPVNPRDFMKARGVPES